MRVETSLRAEVVEFLAWKGSGQSEMVEGGAETFGSSQIWGQVLDMGSDTAKTCILCQPLTKQCRCGPVGS